MDEAAPAAGAAAKKKRPLLRRVPTSLVVTLLGIGLSAWLLPAITRQWDDRQRAHELKASVVAQIASATARALTGGEDILLAPRERRPSRPLQPLPLLPVPRVERQWSIASLEIESRLRAYFPGNTVVTWQEFSLFVDQALNGAAGRKFFGSLASSQPPVADDALPKALRVSLDRVLKPLGQFLRDRRTVLRPHISEAERDFETGLLLSEYQDDVEEALLLLEQRIAAEVLAAHPIGYSTSARDLLHDLIP